MSRLAVGTPRRLGVVIVLFLLVLCTRWPLRATVLEELDSSNYALALLEFDLIKQQPHPPGYIFYVWASRLAYGLVGDPIIALSTVAAVSGAISAVLLLELLTPALGFRRSVVACVATLASAQVWLQQVRPMQDAFAFAWTLACVLALVRATELGGFYRWCVASALIGLAAGAKQVIPIFLAGLVLWAARAAWQRGGARWIAAGAVAALIASMAWFIPLSLHCGSPLNYLEMALGQVAWQRENDAAAFQLSLPRLLAQMRAAFVTSAGPAWLSFPLWSLATVGAASLARQRHATWILWFVVPLVAMRLLLLGTWPRFCLYYLPFVIALAATGVERMLARGVRSPAGRSTLGCAILIGWCGLQAAHVWPTILALHRGPSPAAATIHALAARFPPRDTVLLIESAALERQVHYYARPYGFRHATEADLEPGLLRNAAHVVKIYTSARASMSSDWTGLGEPIGTWRLDMPRAAELSSVWDFWSVAAFELRGAYLSFRRFKMDDAGRLFATENSAIVVFHAPVNGFVLRLRLARAAVGRLVVAGRRAIDCEPRDNTCELTISRAEAAEGRVRIDIMPACGFDDCLELVQAEVIAGPQP